MRLGTGPDAAPAAPDARLDGNSLAGPLAELFAVDLTAAVGCCGGCRASGPLARLLVYGPEPGLVARCPECGQVMLRLVRGETDAWLDLHGTLSLHIPLPNG